MESLSYSKEKTKFCLELDRVSRLLEKAGHPDRAYKIIHVAGTNGKGSVCAFLEAGFKKSGIPCGRFSSPELFSAEDTISIDGEYIKKRTLSNILKRLSPLCDEVESELGKAPSAFEILFVAALCYFKNKHCRYVILECGMGGEGDATNAVETSEIQVLTNIDLDHFEYLGDTIEKITANKCGIIREGKKVFSAIQKEEAEKVIVEICKEKNCDFGIVGECKIISMDKFNIITDVGFGNVELSLAGVHQARNAGVAVQIMRYLEFDDSVIRYSLTHARNRARLEQIAPSTYFDGAHNPAGVRSLVRSINAAGVEGKIIFAIGFMADKDISTCLDELKKLYNKNFEIYTATVESNMRSETSENLLKIANDKGYACKSFPRISVALSQARENSDIAFAFGSLYMYKELFNKNGELK